MCYKERLVQLRRVILDQLWKIFEGQLTDNNNYFWCIFAKLVPCTVYMLYGNDYDYNYIEIQYKTDVFRLAPLIIITNQGRSKNCLKIRANG